MTLLESSYKDIRLGMCTGDTIAFGGMAFESGIIKDVTNSEVSHIGIVITSVELSANTQINLLLESTSLNGFSGVTLRFLSEAIEAYVGNVWWLPLSRKSKSVYNTNEAYAFMRAQQGKLYDTPQAIKSALDSKLPIVRKALENNEDFSKLFCSELDVAQKKAGGLLLSINASECTPSDVCSFNIFDSTYHQLKGARTEIKEFNTMEEENWKG